MFIIENILEWEDLRTLNSGFTNNIKEEINGNK